MNTNTQKFKIGDRVRDTYTGKVGNVTSSAWIEEDFLDHNKAEWAYSIDSLGRLFIGESELEAV